MIEFVNKPTVVLTISGKEVERNKTIECKKDGMYYEKDVDCFYVQDGSKKGAHWYRVNSGKIGFNVDSNSWELLSNLRSDSNIVEGVIDENNSRGFFSIKDKDFAIVYERWGENIPQFLISQELANKLGYIPCLWDECYYREANLNKQEKEHISKPRVKRYKNLPFNYNANEQNNAFLYIRDLYEKAYYNIPERTALVSKFLYDKSIGFEIESSNGSLLQKDLGRLGIVPLKDGSLRKQDGTEPYEFTTVPLREAKGLETLKSICEELNKRCEFDESCSVHIHIGNVKWDRITIIAYYILAQRLQDEIYELFPLYKSDEIKYAGKQKKYNQPLPNIGLLSNKLFKTEWKSAEEFNTETKIEFNKIFEWLCSGQLHGEDRRFNLEMATHPLGNTKWSINSRYFLWNWNCLVFSNQRTIESRILPGSFNFIKLSNWLFFNIAFITYAERFTKEIISGKLKPKINDILNGFRNNFGMDEHDDVIGAEISDYLINYYEYMKQVNAEARKEGDFFSKKIEFAGDREFKYEFKGIKSLY